MRTLLQSISLFALVLATAGCKSGGGGDPAAQELLDTPVYTMVGMHFDAKAGKYLMQSTNYIGVPNYVPPGTKMILKQVNGKGLQLTGEDGTDYVISFNSKHSMMTIGEWRELHFSSQPVELPATLTEEERDAIANGQARVGMSREALFLAIGYPPKSNNPSNDAKVLKYEVRRPFISQNIRFDDNDKVEQVGMNR